MAKKTKHKFIEEDLAEILVNTFQAAGYHTFNEVSIKGGGTNRCDIYAVMSKEPNKGATMVIEAKMTLNLKVIEQAYWWKKNNHCHYAYIAIPKAKKRKDRIFAVELCNALGIGMIEVDLWNKTLNILVKSTLNPKPIPPPLFNEQRLSIAGNSNNEYVTPFKITCANLKKLLEQDGEMVFMKAIKGIKHHYKSDSSACSAIMKYIKQDVISGVKIIYKNRQPHVSYNKLNDTSITNTNNETTNDNNEGTDYRKSAIDM